MLIRDPEVIRARLDPEKRDLRDFLEVSLRRPRPELAMLSTGMIAPSPILVTTSK